VIDHTKQKRIKHCQENHDPLYAAVSYPQDVVGNDGYWIDVPRSVDHIGQKQLHNDQVTRHWEKLYQANKKQIDENDAMETLMNHLEETGCIVLNSAYLGGDEDGDRGHLTVDRDDFLLEANR